MSVLITGGAGFIGSTIASALIDAGEEPIILDNLETGRREFTAGRTFYEGDIGDVGLLHRIFDEHPDISAVIHCAALIVVPDSVARPIEYYKTNVSKTLTMTETLIDRGCTRLIFSSSGATYGLQPDFAVDEESPLDPVSPYTRTKTVVEGMFADIAHATPLRVLSLRYFNPIGADPEMRTGLQTLVPTHALGKLILTRRDGGAFPLTGVDWPTRDGSGIRDYIHVWDLARAHVLAWQRFDDALGAGHHSVINLGTGTGTTTKELVAAFERVTGEPVQVEVAPRRPGDNAGQFTKSDKAASLLGWKTEYTLDEGIADTLTWFAERPKILPDLA